MQVSNSLPLLASCCTPGPKLDVDEAAKLAQKLKALADPVRLQLLSLIANSKDCCACVCDLQADFELSQPTISHHLKTLLDSGLITREKRGTWAYYSLNSTELSLVAAAIRPGEK